MVKKNKEKQLFKCQLYKVFNLETIIKKIFF